MGKRGGRNEREAGEPRLNEWLAGRLKGREFRGKVGGGAGWGEEERDAA